MSLWTACVESLILPIRFILRLAFAKYAIHVDIVRLWANRILSMDKTLGQIKCYNLGVQSIPFDLRIVTKSCLGVRKR